MGQEVLSLLRWRWQVLRRTRTWLEPVLFLVATVGGLLGFFLAFKLGAGLRLLGPGFQWMILAFVLLLIQSVLLGTSMARVVAALYLDSDLELLLAAPLRVRSVFAARLLEVLAFPGLLILYLLLAALWGLGVGVGMGPGYYPLTVLIVLFLPLLPVALGTLLMMALVRYLPAWRLREMLAVAGSLLWLLFYVTSQVFSADLEARLLPMMQALFSGDTGQGFATLDPGLLPGNWAAWSLIAGGLGRAGPALLYVGLFVLISLAAYGVCLLAAERLYLSGWAGVGVVQRHRQPARPTGRAVSQHTTLNRTLQDRASGVSRRMRWLPAGIWGVITKDWRMLRRDLRTLLQLAWPLAFALVWLTQGRLDTVPLTFLGDPMMWWTGLSVTWLLVMVLTPLAVGAISREGRSFWVLRSAPLSARDLIAAKFWGNMILCLGLGLPFSLGVAWLQGTGLMGFTRSLGLVMLMGTGLTAISLALGAQSPNLTWEDPRRAYPREAGCAGYVAGGVYALIVVAILAVPTGLAGRSATWDLLLASLRLAAVVGLTAGVVWKALRLAIRSVEAVEL